MNGSTKMVAAEYLERAHQFERMADSADDPEVKKQLLDQAGAYRRLAEKHAEQQAAPVPPPPQAK